MYLIGKLWTFVFVFWIMCQVVVRLFCLLVEWNYLMSLAHVQPKKALQHVCFRYWHIQYTRTKILSMLFTREFLFKIMHTHTTFVDFPTHPHSQLSPLRIRPPRRRHYKGSLPCHQPRSSQPLPWQATGCLVGHRESLAMLYLCTPCYKVRGRMGGEGVCVGVGGERGFGWG